MSLVHKLPENLNKNLIYQRISAGQAITFAWEKTTTPTRNLVHAYADSLGCPAEYIIFPLLTVTASFIGTHGTKRQLGRTCHCLIQCLRTTRPKENRRTLRSCKADQRNRTKPPGGLQTRQSRSTG